MIHLGGHMVEEGFEKGEHLAKVFSQGSELEGEMLALAGQAKVIANGFKGAGVVGNLVLTGIAINEMKNQYNKGGVREIVHHRAIIDAGVGIAGASATILATVGIISNPVGWAIGIGCLAYGVGTLIWDQTHE